MYALAQSGEDEGPICNLGMITQYLSQFMEEYSTVITASWVNDSKFSHTFFSSFTYALYRLDETEYEDANDPFPKGRVSFLTIHQSKRSRNFLWLLLVVLIREKGILILKKL
jgi:DNA helicase-2/ATP-dependent DNA helicase PcrA